jgi:hypothetical protein
VLCRLCSLARGGSVAAVDAEGVTARYEYSVDGADAAGGGGEGLTREAASKTRVGEAVNKTRVGEAGNKTRVGEVASKTQVGEAANNTQLGEAASKTRVGAEGGTGSTDSGKPKLETL